MKWSIQGQKNLNGYISGFLVWECSDSKTQISGGNKFKFEKNNIT